jgi:hypothetical protein
MDYLQWVQANWGSPRTKAEYIDTIGKFLQAHAGAHAWERIPGNPTLENRAQQAFTTFLTTNPVPGAAPAPAAGRGAAAAAPAVQPQAAQNWRRALQTMANGLRDQIVAAGNGRATIELTQARARNTLASATARIPSPTAFFSPDVGATHRFERIHVQGYIDYLLAAIEQYITTAVPHSNARKRVAELFTTKLRAFRGSATVADAPHFTVDIFEQAISGLTDSNTLAEVAEYWSRQRQGTEARITRFRAACQDMRGEANETSIKALRRYGSAAEGDHIRQQKGFYQKLGVSFEQYKWFLDLRVENATTSVSDREKAFYVYLKPGARALIHRLEELYNRDDQPALIHKPDMGGEVGCFGVHEDVLPDFNRQMIHEIVIHDQATRRDEASPVRPA